MADVSNTVKQGTTFLHDRKYNTLCTVTRHKLFSAVILLKSEQITSEGNIFAGKLESIIIFCRAAYTQNLCIL